MYSVLMSVYYKERPEFLEASMNSMFAQTIPTDDFVLVCDGPLSKELDAVVEQMEISHGDALRVLRLGKNSGLGNALNEGIKCCRHELIARMDSDDISYPDRCERQLAAFKANPDLDIISGTIEEFSVSTNIVTGRRKLPCSHEEICAFAKKRNPFNHPAVMFKKTSVATAGGYNEEYRLFEDYYLWVRMLMNGSKAMNLREPLLYMRTPIDIYRRRGGWEYAKNMLCFHRWMCKKGWISWKDYLTGAIPHAVICIIPNGARKTVYRIIR